MEDSELTPSEDVEPELEAWVQVIVRKAIPVLRVATNVTTVVRRLSSASADTLEAMLEARTSRERLEKVRNERRRITELTDEQSDIGAKVGGRLLDEQCRIDLLVFDAIERIRTSEHSVSYKEEGSEEEKREVDDDWIQSFRREAVDRSQGEMREVFVRILAGEIQEPGTFSIKAVRTVGSLSQSTASLFRKAASLRVGLEVISLKENDDTGHRFVVDARIPALGGELDQNYLLNEGLNYDRLIELTENGLLHHDYKSWNSAYTLAMPRTEFGGGVTVPYTHKDQPQGIVAPIPDPDGGGGVTIPFIHQDQKWKLTPLSAFKAGSEFRIQGAEFTTVGKELLHVVDIEHDAAFLDKVRTYLASQHIEMTALP